MEFFEIFLVFLFGTYFLILATIFVRRYLKRSRSIADIKTESVPRECNSPNDHPLIEVINVEKGFDVPVLKGITVSVDCGQTLGVLGQSGTGKSVLLKLIAGFHRPDSGMILINGSDITQLEEDDLLELRKRVSYVFQGGAFFDFLNVRENIAYPLRERGVTDEDAIEARVNYLLEAVEMEGMGDLQSEELSVGARKQVAIARSIAINPDVILYDEPTTGVDPIIGKSLSRLIRKLGTQENLTSIVVTHDLKCLEIVSDKLVILKDGFVRFQGSVDAFYASKDPFVDAFRSGKRFAEPNAPLPA